MARSGEPCSSVCRDLTSIKTSVSPSQPTRSNLASASRQAVIAIHDDDSGALQKPLGDVLAVLAEGVLVSHAPTARVLPEEVREFIEALHRVIWKCRSAPNALIHDVRKWS
jgi:hypothetical protein